MINSFHQDGADWRNVLEYRGIPFNFEETKHVQQGGLYSPGWDRFVILDSSFNRNRTIILYFRDRFINFSTFGDFGSLMDPSIWKARGWRYCESTTEKTTHELTHKFHPSQLLTAFCQIDKYDTQGFFNENMWNSFSKVGSRKNPKALTQRWSGHVPYLGCKSEDCTTKGSHMPVYTKRISRYCIFYWFLVWFWIV